MKGQWSDIIKPWIVGIGAMGGGYLGVRAMAEVPEWLQLMIQSQGSDFLMAVVVLGAAIYFAPGFIAAHEKQAIALNRLSDTVLLITEQVNQRNLMFGRMEEKLDEVMINQRLFVSRLDQLKDTLAGIGP